MGKLKKAANFYSQKWHGGADKKNDELNIWNAELAPLQATHHPHSTPSARSVATSYHATTTHHHVRRKQFDHSCAGVRAAAAATATAATTATTAGRPGGPLPA